MVEWSFISMYAEQFSFELLYKLYAQHIVTDIKAAPFGPEVICHVNRVMTGGLTGAEQRLV